MRIGELSIATGVNARTLRYYEQKGLLHSDRQSNEYCDYTPKSAEVVLVIQDLFAAEVTSDLLRDIMPCATERQATASCAELYAKVSRVQPEGLCATRATMYLS